MARKPPENNPWASLSTFTTFDKGSHSWTTRRMDDTEVQGGGQIIGRVAPSTSLLIESLVQQLCTMFEGDAVRRNKLYYAICDRLHEMKLIDGSYNMIEFEIMRGQYQVALYKLVTVARASTGSESPLQVPNCLMSEWSRYRREFQEIGFIAAGGFGNVFKALHRLDGNEYAIKKIVVKSGRVKTIMQHLEEVKTIAKLNHTNIVSYKGAWIEPTFPETFVPSLPTVSNSSKKNSARVRKKYRNRGTKSLESIDKSKNIKKDSLLTARFTESFESESDSPGEINKPSESMKVTYKTGMYISFDKKLESKRRGSAGGYVISHDVINERFQQLNSSTNIIGERISERLSSRIVDDDGLSDVVSFRNETRESEIPDDDDNDVNDSDEREIDDFNDNEENIEDSSDSYEDVVRERRICAYRSSPTPQEYATLYIQMALCDQTLRQWIDGRRIETEIPQRSIVVAILTQILSGLEYIHSCKIVHHDIKPGNIFVSASGNLQIQLGDFGLACPLNRESHHSMVGTPTYAAPEQLRGKCDPKSDIYSLGIVLFELLFPMQTQMERSRVLSRLKLGQFPPEFTNSHEDWEQQILRMIQEDPQTRPSTSELFKSVSQSKDTIIAELREENSRKDDVIQKLQDRVAQLEEIVKRLENSVDNT